jgi:penicillin-insensitive murein DD-endopeptidase
VSPAARFRIRPWPARWEVTLLLGVAVGALLPAGSAGMARAGESSSTAGLPARFKEPPFSLMSLSIGAPNEGRQLRAKRLRATNSLKIKTNSKGRSYGHPALVLMLQRSAKDVASASPASVMVVGDLSLENGGTISGHRSHQSGRDADVGFYLRDDKGRQVVLDRFVQIDRQGRVLGEKNVYFDDNRNWLLVRSWLRDKRAGISHVFVASHVRARILEFARSSKARSRHYDAAAALLHQPSNSASHDDHFHVRIDCPKKQSEICVREAVSD